MGCLMSPKWHCWYVAAMRAEATCSATVGVADVATSHDPTPFFLTPKAKIGPRLELNADDLPC